MSLNYHPGIRNRGYNSAPEGWSEPDWHQSAIGDANTSHTLPGRLYIVQCEWCPEAFAALNKSDAMEMFRAHERSMLDHESSVTATDPRVNEIEARHRDCLTYNFGMHAADKLAHEDVSYLLAELRKAHEALTRVEAECAATEELAEIVIGEDLQEGLRMVARGIRAAVAAANGDKAMSRSVRGPDYRKPVTAKEPQCVTAPNPPKSTK